MTNQARLEARIRTKDGKVHDITTATMMAAMDRAENYLREARRWSKEHCAFLKALSKAIDSGVEKEHDTKRHDLYLKRAGIPESVWFPLERAFSETDMLNVMATLEYFQEGALEDFSADYDELEQHLDLDPTYILFGLPIYDLPLDSQAALRKLGAEFASRKLTPIGRNGRQSAIAETEMV